MRKQSSRRLGLVCLGLIGALTACNSGKGSSSAPSGLESRAQAIASSTPNAAVETMAKTKATSCVNKYTPLQLVKPANLHQLAGCLGDIVPPAQRPQVEKCLLDTAFTEKVWKSDGKAAFEDHGAADCVKSVSATPSVTSTSVPTLKPTALAK